MFLVNLLFTLVSFLFYVNPVYSAAIYSRDNACTACLATIEAAVNTTGILDPNVSDDQKKEIMHEQVCPTLANTPLFYFCEAYTDAWSPALYHYLIEHSCNATSVCVQPQFKAC